MKNGDFPVHPAGSPSNSEADESEWNEFDSSYRRGSPTSFAPNQVGPGRGSRPVFIQDGNILMVWF